MAGLGWQELFVVIVILVVPTAAVLYLGYFGVRWAVRQELRKRDREGWSCPPSVDTRSLGTTPMRRCSHAPYQAGLSA